VIFGPAEVGTIQLVLVAQASRLVFSAFRRKYLSAAYTTILCGMANTQTIRRDAD
jgi:hypothetical protein